MAGDPGEIEIVPSADVYAWNDVIRGTVTLKANKEWLIDELSVCLEDKVQITGPHGGSTNDHMYNSAIIGTSVSLAVGRTQTFSFEIVVPFAEGVSGLKDDGTVGVLKNWYVRAIAKTKHESVPA